MKRILTLIALPVCFCVMFNCRCEVTKLQKINSEKDEYFRKYHEKAKENLSDRKRIATIAEFQKMLKTDTNTYKSIAQGKAVDPRMKFILEVYESVIESNPTCAVGIQLAQRMVWKLSADVRKNDNQKAIAILMDLTDEVQDRLLKSTPSVLEKIKKIISTKKNK